MRADLRLILCTAFTQTVGWGTLFTPFALLVQPMEADLGWSRALISGAFTLGLLVSGVAAIPVGRWLDRRGGRWPLAGGALLGAAGLLLWSLAAHPAMLYAAWVVIGLAHALALWTAAMAVVIATARDATRAVTLVSLMTGFTGTIFIPLVAALEAGFGWRGALQALAGLEALAALVALWQFRGAAPPAPAAGRARPETLRAIWRRPGFPALALCFALHAFIATAIGAHLVPLLREAGLAEAAVLALAALHGPVQVAARATIFLVARRARTLAIGVAASWLLPAGLLWLALSPAQFWLLLPFVALWATADGLLTIVRAAGTAEILGREGYGAVTGALTLLSVGPRMAGPVAAALIWQAAGGYAPLPWLLAALGAVAALAFAAAARAGPR